MKKDIDKIMASLEPVIDQFVDQLTDKIFLALEDILEVESKNESDEK